VFLIRRNMDYLLGEGPTDETRREVIEGLLELPAIERLTYLHLEFVGPQRFFVVAAVDLVGDDAESDLAVRLHELEQDIERHPLVEDAVLTLALPDAPSLTA
jgi:hypothetical protein